MGVMGKVAKIEGNKVTVEDDMGKETTVEVKDVKNAKVGDKVKIKDGIIEIGSLGANLECPKNLKAQATKLSNIRRR